MTALNDLLGEVITQSESLAQRERGAAATGGDQSLGPGSPDPGDAGSPASDRVWLNGHGIGPASIGINGQARTRITTN